MLVNDLRHFATDSVDSEPVALIVEWNANVETMVGVIRGQGGVVQLTVVGDPVNDASRVETDTQQLGVEVGLSDAVVKRA